MGVYIPPPSSGKEDGKSAHILGSVPPPLTYSLENLLRGNPSVGLKVWGPLVPASDDRFALFALSTFQVFIGVSLLGRFMRLRKTPGPRTFGSFVDKTLSLGLGASAIFSAGLEFPRLGLSYDPWRDEAEFYRRLVIKNGVRPDPWIGPIGYYRPMGLDSWLRKVGDNLVNVTTRLEDTQAKDDTLTPDITAIMHQSQIGDSIKSLGIVPPPVGQAYMKFKAFHSKIRERNQSFYQELLSGSLKDVNELNKAARLDSIMEGTSDVQINEEYAKPQIQLGSHRLETDEEFEMVWYNFEPWDELKIETTYDVRLIPKWSVKNNKAGEEPEAVGIELEENQ